MAITRDVPATSEPIPRRFSVAEYYRMAEVGILGDDDRVELIDGVIVQLPPIGSEHADVTDELADLPRRRLGERARVRHQNPVHLDDHSEPEPDVALVRTPEQRGRSYRSGHPVPRDLFLIVEVADSTVAFDLGQKALMYARAGIQDYWVLDLPGGRLIVHREPMSDGYATVTELRRGQTVRPLAFSDVAFSVDEILA